MRTLWTLIRSGLRALLGRVERAELPPLPSFRGGIARVDIADREALDVAMGDELFPRGS